ncbi:hypothetical protein [Bradyrhizobium sp. JYMT SZCCT0428]|uniref:hypothetical protein n=1 Tax=Bradyrhizobium sp. JYMT SZCCT0428 TaxID=2807673 RepID=UPI001BA65942|nr:hypothetical protein [Bradyrhizobium sp. JYMT SZCCT0428]MBR1154371.1 hypothetical protein [Bradyrhizobium sp. JYMT SZCCT0428]
MTDAIPETTTAAAKPSVRSALLAAAGISIGTLLLATFELSMAEWPSALVLLGILPLTALMFFGCCLWTATLLLRIPRGGARFAIPFLMCAATLALLVYAPLQKVALQRNFHWHRADRERIVARVETGELKPNVPYNKSMIALGATEPNVSAGGNDIVVDTAKDGTYVLFLTSRGLKHYFTGFLHVPPGSDPKDFFEFDDKPPSQLVHYDKNWYFVAN